MENTNLIKVRIEKTYESGKRKSWHKALISIDDTKKNGYAFLGDFLPEGEKELPLNTVILEVYPTGSVARSGQSAILSLVQADGSLLEQCDLDWRKENISIKNMAKELLKQKINPLANYSIAELRAEINRREK